MVPERRRAASSDELSSESSSSEGADQMELEAAEALAGMAYSAGRGNEGKWGGKGKRAKSKRVKSESPRDDQPVDSVPDPPLDPGVAAGDQGRSTGCTYVLLDPAKAEPEVAPDPESELPKMCTSRTRSPHGVGADRCRQNITEEEKEARRLRRVLANRESARQTIRRRQAVCEELTQKATDLALENENLKREKELVLNEYHSLEVLNKRLKTEMAKALKVEMEEARELKLVANGHAFVKDRHPFSPVFWPSVVQSANVQSQSGPQNPVLIPSNISIPPNRKIESPWQQQESALQVNRPRTPLYLVPCPWFFPVPEHSSEFLPQPAVGINHMQDANLLSNFSEDVGPSNGDAPTENVFSLQVMLEDTSPGEVRLMTDLNEAPAGCPPEEDTNELLLTSLALSSVTRATPIKQEISSESEHNPVKGNPVRASQRANDFAHRSLHQCNVQGKQLVDAATAARAMRKRKELTKLKNLQGRQCKTSC